MIWGQVCESDEIYSPRTRKWYEVTTVSTTDTQARIRLKGVGPLLVRPIRDEIPAGEHRRGATGKAFDVFVVAFSGQNRR